MSIIGEIRHATEGMPAFDLLRYLLIERFPGKCVVTSALRARSIVVLDMVAEIEPATPIVFCHAPKMYPESARYRDHIIANLGLTDVRDHGADETEVAPGDVDHTEIIQTRVFGGGTVRTTVHLNRSLAGFECWISAGYHRAYSGQPEPRYIDEGRLVRIDPMSGWHQADVSEYMAEHGLPHHPRIVLPPPVSQASETEDRVATYHY